MRVLVTGAGGQLGSEIAGAWGPDEVLALSRAELDITDRAAVDEAIAERQPELVVNGAAFTQVDACETEVERAFSVNAFGPLHLADSCRGHGAALMHISTDYVFNGQSKAPYREDEPVSPISVYGLSKATGEELVRAVLPEHYIVRTAGLYGSNGTNFVDRMLQLASEGRAIRVVEDQVTSTTFTRDLTPMLRAIAATGRFGTYHATNSGACSWFEFAQAIFEISGIDAQVEPTTTAAYGAPARRPAYSVLANSALASIEPLRSWREALREYLIGASD